MKKIVRLTEADVERLVKKILKESDFDDFGFVPEFEENPAKEFLYNLMQNLTISESKNRPGWVVYKNKKGQILMADDANILYVDYDKIWKKLIEMGLNYEEIEQLLINVLEMTFNRKVVTARMNTFAP